MTEPLMPGARQTPMHTYGRIRRGDGRAHYPDGDLPAWVTWERPEGPVVDEDPWRVEDEDLRTYSWCAMCGWLGTTWLDHSHDNGLTRGRLCPRCNQEEARSDHRAFRRWREGCNPATFFGVAYLKPGPVWSIPPAAPLWRP